MWCDLKRWDGGAYLPSGSLVCVSPIYTSPICEFGRHSAVTGLALNSCAPYSTTLPPRGTVYIRSYQKRHSLLMAVRHSSISAWPNVQFLYAKRRYGSIRSSFPVTEPVSRAKDMTWLAAWQHQLVQLCHRSFTSFFQYIIERSGDTKSFLGPHHSRFHQKAASAISLLEDWSCHSWTAHQVG